jgi:SpoVK/Ycf46/Vps4 family AAA+-type ATPase
MLLYGPPGTGKSFLIRAIANHFKVKLVTIIGSELSKYYGEAESRIRYKFDEALKR